MAKDPVCGMEVNEKKAVAIADYKGKTYCFCALSCKDKFVKEPKIYAEGTSSPSCCDEKSSTDCGCCV
jgi:YHS domain-containing protein